MAKPNASVFSIETSSSTSQQNHRQHENAPPPSQPTKTISIINQPLPEIPTQHKQQLSSKSPQVLCAANLTNFPTNYRSLQRPAPTKASYLGGTTQRNRESRPAIPAKVAHAPILPPKSRGSSGRELSRAQQPLPAIPNQYPSSRGYEREKSRDRDRDRDHRERSIGRAYDDSHQYRISSKQLQQQNFQTLPHHHHHPQAAQLQQHIQQTTFMSGSHTGTKKSKRGSRELLQQPFENYSATEL